MKSLIECELKSKFQNKRVKVKFKQDLTISEFIEFTEIAQKYQNIRAINFFLKNKEKMTSGMRHMDSKFEKEVQDKIDNAVEILNTMDMDAGELAEAMEMDSIKITRDNFFVDLKIVQFMIDTDSIKLKVEKDLIENNDFWFGISRKEISDLANNFRVSIL